jgi:cytochrome c
VRTRDAIRQDGSLRLEAGGRIWAEIRWARTHNCPAQERGANRMRLLVMAGIVVMASAGAGAAQDLGAGETSFRKCTPCHDIGPTAKVKLGPPLNGLDGRKAGTYEGFNYSPANKNSGITWDHDAFAKYIKNPMQAMPGTRMAFVGIRNDKEIEDLWAYLIQFKEDGSKK